VNANGVGDACEFDKDGDGIFDSIDNCVTKSNPGQADQDRDWYWGWLWNCRLFNPDQKDSNANGVGNVCEDADTFAKENDSDQDGILDFSDNCPNIANPNQADSDQDRRWDACDNCPKIQNFDQADLDKDSVGDMCQDIDRDGIDGYRDNCPNIANPDQADSDNDGVGNVCGDLDWDTVVNLKDNCPDDYNPDQNDVDQDKKWDACDIKDDRYMESNKDFFLGIMFLIVVIFGVGIFAMVSKLKASKK